MSDTIRTDYAYFDTYNFSGAISVSGYALDISPFTFVPRINDVTGKFSNDRILWDFGDGTTSKTLCASHTYLFPGRYNVTLYLYDSGGDAIYDTFSQTIVVKNFVTDTISLSSGGNYINKASHIENPFTVFYSNSWQSYPAVSSEGGYTINLFVSGSNAPFITADSYNGNAWSHLKPYAKFYKKEYNTISNTYDNIIIDKFVTNDKLLYAKLSGDSIVFCNIDDTGSTFVGTSGSQDVYYVDDLPDIGYSFRDRKPAIISIYFDTKIFDDQQSYNNKYFNYIDRPEYSVIQTIPVNTFYTTIEQLSVNQLTFTSNGIDGEGTTDNTFKINPTQYKELRIPIVIKLKDIDNYSTKYINALTARPLSASTNLYEIKIAALTGNDVLDVNFISDFRDLSSYQTGGFWKGYFIPDFVSDNVYLSATAQIYTPSSLQYPTPLAFVTNPNQYILHRVNIQSSYNYCNGSFNVGLDGSTSQISTLNYHLSSLTAVAVYPDNRADSSFYSIWAGDNIKNIIAKYDTFGDLLSVIELSAAQLSGGISYNFTPNRAGNSIAIDGNSDIWVSLFTSGSAIKINNITGEIDYVINPHLNTINTFLSSTTNVLNTLSADTLQSIVIDTDVNNNVWVAYSHPVSSMLIQYTSTGSMLSAIPLSSNYVPIDIVVNYSGDVWLALQNRNNTGPLSAYNDIVAKYDYNSASLASIAAVSGAVGNITLDVNENIYVTANQYSIVKVDSNLASSIITLPVTTTQNNSATDLYGIAGTATEDILVVNNTTSSILRIDATVGTTAGSLSSISIPRGDSSPDYDIYDINGDWTGFRWINKYGRTLSAIQAVSGVSDLFNVYSESGRYAITKINEDFDATQLYKDLRYQETLQNDTVMFDTFIGTIVGNISSIPDSLGKRVNEKTSNFVDNIINPDTCNIEALFSLFEMHDIDITNFDQNKFTAPANFKRLVDILSIKHSKLWGTRSKFAENFNINGYCPGDSPALYGSNLGSELDINTTILTAGSASEPIVAHEIYSNNYLLINTNVLSSKYIEFRDSNTLTYELSSYHPKWGWGLTLPESVSGIEVKSYYKFYNYINTYENTQVEGIINWEDILNTLQESNSGLNEWFGDNQIAETILTYGLYKGLRLFTSSADIEY